MAKQSGKAPSTPGGFSYSLHNISTPASIYIASNNINKGERFTTTSVHLQRSSPLPRRCQSRLHGHRPALHASLLRDRLHCRRGRRPVRRSPPAPAPTFRVILGLLNCPTEIFSKLRSYRPQLPICRQQFVAPVHTTLTFRYQFSWAAAHKFYLLLLHHNLLLSPLRQCSKTCSP